MVDSAPHMVHYAPMITEVNMATINVRKEASKLYIDFRYKGVRCREQTRMSDTVQNRRRLKRLVNRIDAITQMYFQIAKRQRFFLIPKRQKSLVLLSKTSLIHGLKK
jgi:hypothetical protein